MENFVLNNWDNIATINWVVYIAVLLIVLRKPTEYGVLGLAVCGWAIVMQYVAYIGMTFMDVDSFLINTFISYICVMVPIAITLNYNKNKFVLITIIILLNVIMISNLIRTGVISWI